MNIYQNLLSEKNQNNLITSLCQETDQIYVLSQIIDPNVKTPQPFHINCNYSKKKICYCEFSEEQLMPKKQLIEFQNMSQFLDFQYKSINKSDIQNAIQQKIIMDEKIKNIQESKDFYKILPKFQFLFEEKIQNILECYGQCLQCKFEGETIFYQKNDSYVKNLQTLYCEKCVKMLGISNFELWNPYFIRKKENKFDKKKNSIYNYKQRKSNKINIPQKTKLISQQQVNDFCHWEACKKSDNQEDMLCCQKCLRKFHAKCCNPPLNSNLVKRFPWFCNECKKCQKCLTTANENKLLICDCCDRAIHISCLTPAKKEVPINSWFCGDCSKCHSCDKKIILEKNKNIQELQELSNQIIDKNMLCLTCFQEFQKKNYCPICMKVIQQESEGDFVYCDICQLWLHIECEGLTQSQFKTMQNQSEYRCSKCK